MRVRSGPLRRTSLLALALGLAPGCLGKSPIPDYYTLAGAGGSGAAAARLARPELARPELGIAVGPIEIPRYLDRPELVTRLGAHGLVPWNEHRWGGSLRTDVLDAVAQDLGAQLGTLRVAVYPTEARFPVDVRVLIAFLAFDGEPGGAVQLHAVWTLVGVDGRALAIEESRLEEPVASAAWEDFVTAQRAALARLDAQIAARIDTALPRR